jgi:hypothetical protein
LLVLIHYEDSYLTKDLSIDIKNQESAEIIYIDKIELLPGQVTQMIFTINNVGSAPLREITFSWENEDDIILPVGSDDTRYVKYIDVGQKAELMYNVIASGNAEPDLYKLDLSLKYENSGTEEEINTKAGIYVGGATDFDVAFSGVSSGETSFSISNIGSVSASSVTVRIPDQQGWKVSGSNSVIIGNLNEGDYTIASFVLRQTSTSATRQLDQNTKTGSDVQNSRTQTQDPTVKLEIIYTDSRGNRNTIEKEITVDATSFIATSTLTANGGSTNMANIRGQKNTTTPFWTTGKLIFVGLIIFVVLILLNRKYKHEKMKNPNYTYGMFFKSIIKKFSKKR